MPGSLAIAPGGARLSSGPGVMSQNAVCEELLEKTAGIAYVRRVEKRATKKFSATLKTYPVDRTRTNARVGWIRRSMPNVRLARSICSATANILRGSHKVLESLFLTAGAPGPPPDLSHAEKWKDWLFAVGQNPEVDSLAVLGNILEEFMDTQPSDAAERDKWQQHRCRIVEALEQEGFRYYRGGRILPNEQTREQAVTTPVPAGSCKPGSVDELLVTLLKGLRRAMHPLSHRRKGSAALSFATEYDVQDLLHALLRPWVADIRPEEVTPSFAGSSTRMDFLLPAHRIVIELKFVRDSAHARRIGDELIVDIDHYRKHPDCDALWCVVYDPDHLLQNAEGLKGDLEGTRTTKDGAVNVLLLVV